MGILLGAFGRRRHGCVVRLRDCAGVPAIPPSGLVRRTYHRAGVRDDALSRGRPVQDQLRHRPGGFSDSARSNRNHHHSRHCLRRCSSFRQRLHHQRGNDTLPYFLTRVFPLGLVCSISFSLFSRSFISLSLSFLSSLSLSLSLFFFSLSLSCLFVSVSLSLCLSFPLSIFFFFFLFFFFFFLFFYLSMFSIDRVTVCVAVSLCCV